MPKKPSCSKFIVAAIRATRPARKGLKPGTSVSKGLRFIFSLARGSYSEEEFRGSLNSLLRRDEIILVAEVMGVGDPLISNESFHAPFRFRKIPQILPNTPLNCSGWYQNGERIVDTHDEADEWFWRPRLFVAMDGLPAHIEKCIAGVGTTKAEQIMESLKKQK